MEYLPNGYSLEIPEGAFPLSTDSMVLSHFVKLPKNARVLDLGSGCGTLGLLLCAREESCAVTGVELEESAHLAALANIRRNALEPRMQSICADLRSVSERFSPCSFSCCVSNPPYFSGGPAGKKTPFARREDTCTPEELFRAAAWALTELIARASEAGLEAKRLRLVRHRPDSPVSLVLLQLRKGAKPGLQWEEITLRGSDGTASPVWQEIYHLAPAK